MNILVLFFVLASNNRINTSFYTYHRVGGHSITDFYLNYVLNRYDLRFALEKRQDDFGLKSITFEIDSVLGDFRLALGEKPYHVRSSVSTNLSLWGLSLTSRGADIFLGKSRDHTTSLPPTFDENRYVAGVRLHRQLSPRIPLDFYILRRSDNNYATRVSSNNSLGINSEVKIGDKLTIDNRLWASHTEQGMGASYAFNGRFTAQKIGGHCHIMTMSRDFVPLSSVKMQRGSWFRLNTYQRPTEWLSFTQDLNYASLHDTRITLNTRLSPTPLPALTYSISLSRETVSQIIDGEWLYKKFGVSANYEVSTDKRAYGVRLTQQILNCQMWSSFQRRESDVWQFGLMFPFPRYFRFKGFFNYATRSDYCSHTTGFELSSRFFKDLNLHFTYEYIRQNESSDQFLSFSVSKTFDFERIGLSFISGRVFMDVNNNGIYDFGDSAMADIDVVVDGKSTAKTDRNGVYAFRFVRSGRHSINVNFGCMPAEIGTAHRTQSVDTRFLSQARINFPLEVMGSLRGTVYFDNNNNGQMDDSEEGVPNVVLALNGYLTTTDGDGKFRFANLASGTYMLEPKVLPPETVTTRQEFLYVYIRPGADFEHYTLGIMKKERPINKKVFD